MNLRTGQRVIISGSAGTVAGTVEQVSPATAAGLPDLPGAPDPSHVAAILAEADITHVAWITYAYTPAQQLMFAALRDREGKWWDLRGEELAIDPA